ncbi:MAG: ATPase, T2SS/T4P/T4SS family [Candidatus Melainabacteria bacterium]|nr:ATPase, T2SS/T4P/T4SS family [Candidatus Melainabacteria bacterium]
MPAHPYSSSELTSPSINPISPLEESSEAELQPGTSRGECLPAAQADAERTAPGANQAATLSPNMATTSSGTDNPHAEAKVSTADSLNAGSPNTKPDAQAANNFAANAPPRAPATAAAGPARKRIGDILVEEGYVSLAQMDRALSESRATGLPVGAVLVKQGIIEESTLGRALAKLHGLQYAELSQLQLESVVVNLLPLEFMKRNLVVPLELDSEGRRLYIAMARPDNLRILDEVALITGYRVIPKVMTHNELLRVIDKLVSEGRISSDAALARAQENLSTTDNLSEGMSDLEAEMAAEDAPIVQFVNALLIEAIESNASDIHLEPQKEHLLIRFRVDGILREIRNIPRKMSAAVVSRIKVVSGMDIAERRRPQDGRMKIKVGTSDIDMRVNSLAVQFGEKIVIRILKPTATSGGLEKLGFTSSEVQKIHKMIRAPHGIILVTGPTGSGKTTTLYAGLREINTPERNITTIEDPIEYPLAGINQTQVSHKAGLTFALCLRAILRQDPDVIMVGEIRDHETLEAAIHAALTGHLVFSTIHTNSTAKTITRLLEMGAPPYLVSTAVIGILAQRLVRRICPKCKVAYQANEEELQLLGIQKKPTTLYRGTGCDRCGGSGYEGRVGLYEIMNIHREIEELIDSGGSVFAIQDAAVRNGMLTLGMDGKRKALAGITTVDEVIRVIGYNLDSA